MRKAALVVMPALIVLSVGILLSGLPAASVAAGIAAAIFLTVAGLLAIVLVATRQQAIR